MSEQDRPSVVVLASEECQAAIVETMTTGRDPDFTVTKVAVTFRDAGMFLSYETVSAGFGEISFYTDESGQFTIDTEAMSKSFVVDVLVKWLEGANWDR